MSQFPLELLQKPINDRLTYFEAFTVAHPRLKEVYDALMRTINEPAGASFIFVYGPSGVGKTTLKQRIEQKITEAYLSELINDRGRVPVVGIEAVAPESRNFNWKDYYVAHWEYFYERSLGCIGTLKNWLTRTLKDVLAENSDTITLKHLKRRALSVAQCQRMFGEIIEGERQLSETDADAQNLRSLLGLDGDIAQEAPRASSSHQGKVGKRKPKRDKIGVQQDVS